MNQVYELMSRESTAATGSDMIIPRGDGSCMAMLNSLYRNLEPQISKSYRPHVVYIPSKELDTGKSPRDKADKFQRGRNKLKAAQLMISTVNEIQKKKDKRDAKEKGKGPNKDESNDLDKSKGVSQSLPNLNKVET